MDTATSYIPYASIEFTVNWYASELLYRKFTVYIDVPYTVTASNRGDADRLVGHVLSRRFGTVVPHLSHEVTVRFTV